MHSSSPRSDAPEQSESEQKAFPGDPEAPAPELDNIEARHIDALKGSASHILQKIAALASEDEISVGAVIDALEERAFGMLILLFAIPALIPFLVGVHSAVAIPIALLAGQMLIGWREPWLPEKIRRQKISVAAFRRMTASVAPWLKRLEALTKPRLEFVVGRGAERVLALIIILFAGIIAIPGPGTNGVPGFAVSLIAVGVIERDGLLAAIGAVLGIAYGILFFTIGYAAIVFGIEQLMRLF